MFQSAKACRHPLCGHLRHHVATGYTTGMQHAPTVWLRTGGIWGGLDRSCDGPPPGIWGIMVCGMQDATGGGGSAGRRAHRHWYDCFPLITSAARAICDERAGKHSQPSDAKRIPLETHLQLEQPSLAPPLENGAVDPALQVQAGAQPLLYCLVVGERGDRGVLDPNSGQVTHSDLRLIGAPRMSS